MWFGETSITLSPDPVICDVVKNHSAALSVRNSSAAAELFAADAVLEDYALRARIEGALAVGRYLDRGRESLPWGVNATVRHVGGSTRGGGYEWIGNEGAAARDAIIALELDYLGMITPFTRVWDASRTSNTTMETLVGVVME